MEIQNPFAERGATTPLGQYRLYYLDSPAVGQVISESFEFEAESDGAAFAIVDGIREGRPVELWRDARKLRAWTA